MRVNTLVQTSVLSSRLKMFCAHTGPARSAHGLEGEMGVVGLAGGGRLAEVDAVMLVETS